MAISDDHIEGFNQAEREHCEHLAEIGRLARERGVHVPGETKLPALNPDGSEAEAGDDDQDEDDEEESDD